MGKMKKKSKFVKRVAMESPSTLPSVKKSSTPPSIFLATPPMKKQQLLVGSAMGASHTTHISKKVNEQVQKNHKIKEFKGYITPIAGFKFSQFGYVFSVIKDMDLFHIVRHSGSLLAVKSLLPHEEKNERKQLRAVQNNLMFTEEEEQDEEA